MHKEEPSSPANDWVPCEPGALLKLARIQSAISRRSAISKMSAGVITVAATGTAAAVYFASKSPVTTNQSPETPFKTTPVTAISCKKVVCWLPKYVSWEINDEYLLARIEKHLTHCQSCCDVRDKLQA